MHNSKYNQGFTNPPKQFKRFGPYGQSAKRGARMGPTVPSTDRHDRPYFSDQLVLIRVSQYLESISGRNTILDYDRMVDDFQRDYVEYRRKKRNAFKNHLKKAVEVLAIESRISNDDDEFDEDENGQASSDYTFEGEDVNSALEDSYRQQNSKKRKMNDTGDQELISIVTSDEEEQGTTSSVIVKNKKPPTDSKTDEGAAVLQEELNEDIDVTTPLKTEPQSTKKRKAGTSLAANKRFKTSLEPVQPTVSFKDIGGNEKVMQDVTQLLVHMKHPEVYRVLGVSPPRGFLLHGPPGSGKTLLAHAISGELKIPLLKVAAPELVGALSGQSEERIRDLFEQAVALAPCVLFIDEVDAITPNRETAHREMERRIVAQLLSSLDELGNNENGDQVLVIGATNRPDSLDPALRRAGRFDREVCLGIPNRDSRLSILQTMCLKLRLAPELELSEVAMMTPGFVGADLKALVTEAAMAAVNRLFESLKEKEETTVNSTSIPETTEEKGTAEPNKDQSKAPNDNVINEHKEDNDSSGPKLEKDSQPAESKVDKLSNGELKGNKTELTEMDVQEVPLDNEDNSSDIQVLAVNIKGTEPSSSLLNSPPLTNEQLEGVYITMVDFQRALKSVQPSAKREGFATVPDVKWEDVGSLQNIRQELQMAIMAPVKYPKEFEMMGLHTPTGVMLCGPPGCGKTLLAKAVANEAGINFISVKGPELLNMYVGESERAVRQCFERARNSQPCVIFFDEIDALCPKRMNMENGASRVVNQLLTEMDGMEARPGVFLMAATNRPDIVDPAVMRPGRLDKVLYVGLPSADDRVDILRALTKGGKQPVLDSDVDLSQVGRDPRCDGYTGADLAALVREASVHALKEYMISASTTAPKQIKVCSRHFTSAADKIRPSVSEKDKKRYEDLRRQYTATKVDSEVEVVNMP